MRDRRNAGGDRGLIVHSRIAQTPPLNAEASVFSDSGTPAMPITDFFAVDRKL
jgi:hypothetical protein